MRSRLSLPPLGPPQGGGLRLTAADLHEVRPRISQGFGRFSGAWEVLQGDLGALEVEVPQMHLADVEVHDSLKHPST